MIEALVHEVRSETKRANISHTENIPKKVVTIEKKEAVGILEEVCPKCKKECLSKENLRLAVPIINRVAPFYCLILLPRKKYPRTNTCDCYKKDPP
jgi:hypothetical protein